MPEVSWLQGNFKEKLRSFEQVGAASAQKYLRDNDYSKIALSDPGSCQNTKFGL